MLLPSESTASKVRCVAGSSEQQKDVSRHCTTNRRLGAVPTVATHTLPAGRRYRSSQNGKIVLGNVAVGSVVWLYAADPDENDSVPLEFAHALVNALPKNPNENGRATDCAASSM